MEVYNVRTMAQRSESDPKMREAWAIVLHDLDKIYSLAAGKNIPILLMIFPFTFQLNDPLMQLPQKNPLQSCA